MEHVKIFLNSNPKVGYSNCLTNRVDGKAEDLLNIGVECFPELNSISRIQTKLDGGLVHWWKAQNTFDDSITSLKLNSVVPFTSVAEYPSLYAFNFDTECNVLSIGDMELSGDWTLSLFLRYKGPIAGVLSQVLLRDTSFSIKLIQYPNTGKFGVTFYFSGDDFSFDYEVPVGELIHLIITNDGTKTSMFVNGNFIGDGPRLNRLPLRQFGDSGDCLNADIFDIKVFNRVLTSSLIPFFSVPLSNPRMAILSFSGFDFQTNGHAYELPKCSDDHSCKKREIDDKIDWYKVDENTEYFITKQVIDVCGTPDNYCPYVSVDGICKMDSK